MLYFIRDEEGNTYFVLTHDKPGNADGGVIRLYIDSPDLVGSGADVAFFDDTGAMNLSSPEYFYGFCASQVIW